MSPPCHHHANPQWFQRICPLCSRSMQLGTALLSASLYKANELASCHGVSSITPASCHASHAVAFPLVCRHGVLQALDGFSLCLWQLEEVDAALAGSNVFALLHRLSVEPDQLVRRSIITAVTALSGPGGCRNEHFGTFFQLVCLYAQLSVWRLALTQQSVQHLFCLPGSFQAVCSLHVFDKH